MISRSRLEICASFLAHLRKREFIGLDGGDDRLYAEGVKKMVKKIGVEGNPAALENDC